MNPLIRDLIGTLLRKLLTALSAVLVTWNVLSPNQSESFIKMCVDYAIAAIPGLVSAFWSYANQKGWRSKLLVALWLQPGATEDNVKAIIKSGVKSGAVVPTVTTPSNTAPGIPALPPETTETQKP